MAKNYGSAVFQVENALQAVFTPGESRHGGKLDGTAAAHIYSIGAMKTYLSCDIVFARWVRQEFKEKFIGGIGPEMVERFVRSLHDRDLSHATINKYVAAIVKLDAGLRAAGWRAKDAPALVPVDLYSRHADARPAPYSADEARQIIDHLRQICPDRRLAVAAEAAWRGGLRISEVAGLRVSEISVSGWGLALDGHSTKGGRPRTVPLDNADREFFRILRDAPERHGGAYVVRDRKGLPVSFSAGSIGPAESWVLGTAGCMTFGQRMPTNSTSGSLPPGRRTARRGGKWPARWGTVGSMCSGTI